MKKILIFFAFAILASCANPPAVTPSLTAPTATEFIQPQSSTFPNSVIAFTYDTGEQRDIYLINSDGSNMRPVTNDPGWDNWPSWSPDGERIAFTCRKKIAGQGGGICTINADGTNRTQLSNSNDWEPSWSPNGNHISFSSIRDGNPEIYMMKPDGSNPIRLTHDPADDWMSSWSPDAAQLAFVSARDGDWEIYLMDVSDGGKVGDGNLIQLTANQAQDGYPTWSPDGKKIAFMSDRDGNKEIYIMNPDGTDQQRLTNNDREDIFPRWSPDGKWIVYSLFSTTTSFYNYDIAAISMDGAQQVRISLDTPQNEECPNWKP